MSVVGPSAPSVQSATSVEKELAAEQLVSKTVGLEKNLYAGGRPATGKIVAAQATDIFRQTIEAAPS